MNKKKWITWGIVVLVITNALTFYGTRTLSTYGAGIISSLGGEQKSDIAKFDKMFKIRNLLYKYYDGNIDDNVLVEGAIKGMTSALNDPYTVFMNKKEYEDFSSQTEGTYVGLGLQVGAKDNNIVVIAPFDDSPAKNAGILPGDIIQKVNGTTVAAKDLDTAVNMMKGQEGSEVTLTLSRAGKSSFDVKVKREKINLVTVNGEMLDNNIGYIQITMFDEHTADSFNKKLKELKDKNMKGLVLDLRGNPGGILTECVSVVSNFVPKDKVIVSTIDKNNVKKEYKSEGGMAIGMPLVVLTDEGTASASEIVSGAVRDYKAGTLVGKKTFGKGIVQTLIETGEGTALKVTISKYYTPNGENIHKIGIKPDVDVDYPDNLRQQAYNRNTDPQFAKALEIIKGKIK